MAIRIDEPERLTRYLTNYGDHHDDFRGLVLRLISKGKTVDEVSDLVQVPAATIYRWVEDWNKKKRVV